MKSKKRKLHNKLIIKYGVDIGMYLSGTVEVDVTVSVKASYSFREVE